MRIAQERRAAVKGRVFLFYFFREVVEVAPPAKGEGLLGKSTPPRHPSGRRADRGRGSKGATPVCT